MRRLLLISIFGLLFINISCERCIRCRYSFTETIIVETPSGEEEEIVLNEDLILLDDEGQPFGDECLKRSEYKGNENAFTIENFYAIEAASSELDNFEFNCVEL